MTSEEVSKAIGALMTRKKIEARYGPQIKQLNNDGRWFIQIGHKKIMRKSYDRVIDAIVSLNDINSPVKSLERISSDWLMSRMISRSAGTFRRDKQNYDRFIAGTDLAKKDISKISLADGYKWIEKLLTIHPMKEKYWKNIHGTLNSIMSFGGSDVLRSLSIHKDRLLERTKRNDESRIFLSEEKRAVKELAYKDANDKKSGIPLGIPLIFSTGIRDGELCALHWRDIEGNLLHVQSEMVEDTDIEGNFKGYKYVPHCKSEAGDRLIPISSEVRRIFHLVKQYNFANGFPVTEDSYIFLRKDKDRIVPCTTRSFECRIKIYCRQAGMAELKSQHDARRTFATDCFYANMPLKNLQKIMGHSSLKQTQDYIYTKPCDDIHDYLEAINL